MAYPFQLPDLPYAYDALENKIDEATMRIHHTKHHAGYTAKLNAALEAAPELQDKSIETLLKSCANNPALRNNGGGFYNHSLFWTILSPAGGKLEGKLLEAINDSFESLEGFKSAFKAKATGQFGSGWAWLGVNANGKLCLCSTANQDNPLMDGIGGCPCTPILGLDVWEHAYYLNYQNRRGDYVDSFFTIINWTEVSRRYNEAVAQAAG